MFSQLNLEKVNEEVFVTPGDVIHISQREVDFVKKQALTNSRGRARICMHANSEEKLHEMLIAIRKDSYIPPHRHHNKAESLHVIEGAFTVVIFNNDGSIKKSIKLSSSDIFYYRLNAAHYHTLILHTPIVVLHEVTQGPFNKNDSDFAPFAPKEKEKEFIKYINDIQESLSDSKQI